MHPSGPSFTNFVENSTRYITVRSSRQSDNGPPALPYSLILRSEVFKI